MSKTITQIDPASDHFYEWLAMSNTMGATFAKVVTVASNTVGDTTTGNAAINGTFSAGTLVATNYLRGGTVDIPATLSVLSNAAFIGLLTSFSSNVYIVAANVAIYSNSAILAISVQNDGTQSNVTISGNNLVVQANASFNGQSLKIPTGNTGNRPGVVNGAIRYNTDFSTVEVVANNSWLVMTVGNTVIDPATFILKTGDTMTGQLKNANVAFTDIYAANAVANSIVFKADVTFNGAISFASGTISGPLALGSTLNVNGAVTLANTLNVTGLTTFLANVNANNVLFENSVRVPTPAGLHLYTNKTTPADGDEIYVLDSASSFAGARATLTNLWANYVKVKTDALYLGSANVASSAQYIANTTGKILTADGVWGAGAITTLTDAATIAVDMSTFLNAQVTLGGNRQLGNPTNTKVGQSGFIRVIQDGTGSRSLSYASSWKFAGGVAPSLTTTAGATDILYYQVLTSTFIYVSVIKDVK